MLSCTWITSSGKTCSFGLTSRVATVPAGVRRVNALWMEPGCRLTPARRRRLEAELERIQRFVGLDAVRFSEGYLKRDG